MISIMKLLLNTLLDTQHKLMHEYGFSVFGIRCYCRNFRRYFPCIIFL